MLDSVNFLTTTTTTVVLQFVDGGKKNVCNEQSSRFSTFGRKNKTNKRS